MLRTLILTIAALAAPLILTPTAQASPGCADYIKVCARPGAAHTGGGGARPYYVKVLDETTGHVVKVCKSGCDHVKPRDLTLGA